MPKRLSNLNVDTSEVTAFTSAVGGLHARMNTSQHLNAVTKAAFEVLAEEFLNQTHSVARANPEGFHHVYEWGYVGMPRFELFNLQLNGRGGTRTVTWNWRPSASIVPTNETVTGEPRFREQEGFDPERLAPVHRFVWKAPMMEYGVTVTIRPKLAKVLVYPDKNTGAGKPIFDSRPRTVNVAEQEGESVAGNFTVWFASWWDGPIAQNLLNNIFEKNRDNAFQRSFAKRMDSITSSPTRKSSKIVRFGNDAQAASRGHDVARAIAGDMEDHYIQEAARRRRRFIENG